MLAVAQEEFALDRGAAASGTERTCALTREVRPVGELIRFVLGPDGTVVPDVKRKLPGRGLWLTGTRDSIAQAVQRNLFARGFRREAKAPADLADIVDRLLERGAIDALSIAAKAGLVVAGFAKVEAALEKGEALAVIHAADASADGRRKLKADEGGRSVVIDVFPGARLDLALNRPNVVHAALLAGPGSETFLVRVARLVRYRTTNRRIVPLTGAGSPAHNDESTE
jgi:predicted RNA-binding protein YlxR (DUF448 family)